MSFNTASGGQQPMHHPQQQQQQQQQQLFMNPQTENLDQLYSLVGTLVALVQENKKHKASILSKVDMLSTRINRDPEKVKESYEGDKAVFQNFINGSIGSYSTSAKLNRTDDQLSTDQSEDDTDEEIVLKQNTQLNAILKDEQMATLNSVKALSYHEEGFHDIIRALRCDVLNHRKLVLEIARKKFNGDLVPKEDDEFGKYMENVDNFDQLLKLSEVFRSLLKLLNT